MIPTPDQIRAALESTDRRISLAAKALGLSADQLRKLLHRYKARGEKFPKAKGGGWSAVPPGWEPTEEEIAAECEKFQAGWTETAKRQRAGKVGEDVEIPRVELPAVDSHRTHLNETW